MSPLILVLVLLGFLICHQPCPWRENQSLALGWWPPSAPLVCSGMHLPVCSEDQVRAAHGPGQADCRGGPPHHGLSACRGPGAAVRTRDLGQARCGGRVGVQGSGHLTLCRGPPAQGWSLPQPPKSESLGAHAGALPQPPGHSRITWSCLVRGPLVSVPLGRSPAPCDAPPTSARWRLGPGRTEHRSCSQSLKQTEPIFLKELFF